MADRFRCDPEVAGQVARELTQIRNELAAMANLADGSEQATGSSIVQQALRDFFADSSDNRENMSNLLERAAGLLNGLAEGVRTLDTGLADALEPEQPAVAA